MNWMGLISDVVNELGFVINRINKRPWINKVKSGLGEGVKGVEIGVRAGKCSKEILENLSIEKLYLVDPYTPYMETIDVYRDEREQLNYEKEAGLSLKQWRDKTVFVKKTSDAFFEDNSELFDFVYIDGCHEYEQVVRDLINAWACLKQGGFLVGHDWYLVSVAKAVLDVQRVFGFDIDIVYNATNIEYVIKKEVEEK